MTSPHAPVTNQDVDFDDLLDDPAVAQAAEDAATRYDLLGKLVDTRSSVGLTQKQVAFAMETTQSAVSDFENGHTDPHFSTIQRYARAVGVRISVSVEAEMAWKRVGASDGLRCFNLERTPTEFSDSGYFAIYAQHGTAGRRSNYAKAA